MKKKFLKIVALIVASVLILGLLFFANAFLGNPISKTMATNTAKKYLAETYAGTDYCLEEVSYSFKDGHYYAHIESPSSIDTKFSLSITMFGKISYDTYENVQMGFNTAQRLESEYRELTDTVFDNGTFPYESDISFGTLEIYPEEALSTTGSFDVASYAMNQNELVLDKIYDIKEVGKEAGHLVVYVQSDVVTVEEASKLILDVKEIFDRADVPFKAIDFTLQHPLTEDEPRSDEQVNVAQFLYEDIYKEGMVERVQAAHDALEAYYNGISK